MAARVARLDPGLVSRLVGLANRARVLAEAPAASWDRIGRTHPGSRPPSGDVSLLDAIGGRLRTVVDDAGLSSLIAWAESEIDSITHATHVAPESKLARNRRICLEHRGRGARDVAYRERMSVTLVRRIRAEGFTEGSRRRTFLPRDGVEIAEGQ